MVNIQSRRLMGAQVSLKGRLGLIIANDLNRHSRGDRHVKPNTDGTVTLRLSSDTKGKAEDTNFLPVPNEDFYMLLRMYGGAMRKSRPANSCAGSAEGGK